MGEATLHLLATLVPTRALLYYPLALPMGHGAWAPRPHAALRSGECGAAASCRPGRPSCSMWHAEATRQKGSVSAGVAHLLRVRVRARASAHLVRVRVRVG